MTVLGKNVLLKTIEAVPEKQGNFYQATPPSTRIKQGTIHSIGKIDKEFLVKKGDKIFYDSSRQTPIYIKGEELFLVPQEDLLITEDE